MNGVVMCAAVRTPVGRFLGPFARAPATRLGSAAMAAATID